jgi:NADPH-dependent 2,4-dienoyl-CoA reductase/sulfur reductase-like enzyme
VSLPLLALSATNTPRFIRGPRIAAAMKEVDIAVVGGGLGGLAACLALRSRGFNAHVFGKPGWCSAKDVQQAII